MYYALNLIAMLDNGFCVSSSVWSGIDTTNLDAEEKAAVENIVTCIKAAHTALLKVRPSLEILLGDGLPPEYRLC